MIQGELDDIFMVIADAFFKSAEPDDTLIVFLSIRYTIVTKTFLIIPIMQ